MCWCLLCILISFFLLCLFDFDQRIAWFSSKKQNKFVSIAFNWLRNIMCLIVSSILLRRLDSRYNQHIKPEYGFVREAKTKTMLLHKIGFFSLEIFAFFCFYVCYLFVYLFVFSFEFFFRYIFERLTLDHMQIKCVHVCYLCTQNTPYDYKTSLNA